MASLSIASSSAESCTSPRHSSSITGCRASFMPQCYLGHSSDGNATIASSLSEDPLPSLFPRRTFAGVRLSGCFVELCFFLRRQIDEIVIMDIDIHDGSLGKN